MNDKITESQSKRLANDLRTTEEIVKVLIVSKKLASLLISLFVLKFYVERFSEEVWKTKKMVSESRFTKTLGRVLSKSDPRWGSIRKLLKSNLL